MSFHVSHPFIHFIHSFIQSVSHSFIDSFIHSWRFPFISCHVISNHSFWVHSFLSNSPRIPISKLFPIALSYFETSAPARALHCLVLQNMLVYRDNSIQTYPLYYHWKYLEILLGHENNPLKAWLFPFSQVNIVVTHLLEYPICNLIWNNYDMTIKVRS